MAEPCSRARGHGCVRGFSDSGVDARRGGGRGEGGTAWLCIYIYKKSFSHTVSAAVSDPLLQQIVFRRWLQKRNTLFTTWSELYIHQLKSRHGVQSISLQRTQ